MSDGTQVVELANCPFCGATEPIVHILEQGYNAFVSYCDKCEATADIWFSTKEEAANWWNRRATPSPVGASVLWSDLDIERLAHDYTLVSAYGQRLPYVRHGDCILWLKKIRNDYEAHRGASVPSEEVLEAIQQIAWDNINWDLEIFAVVAPHVKTVRAWLAQQRGQG